MNTENNVENAAVETAETTTATAPAERPERTFAPKNNPRRRRKVCPFCADKIDYIDYKDALRLRKFVSERAKILPRRVSGCCAKHQRQLTLAIKRARQVALLPYIFKRKLPYFTAVFCGKTRGCRVSVYRIIGKISRGGRSVETERLLPIAVNFMTHIVNRNRMLYKFGKF